MSSCVGRLYHGIIQLGRCGEFDAYARNIKTYDSNNEVLGNLYFYQGRYFLDMNNADQGKSSLVKAREYFSKVFKPDHQVFKAIDSVLKDE